MNDWLAGAAVRLGAGSVGDAEAAALLELARVAARESGDRTNAPLVCYLVGLAHSGDPGRPLAELARLAAGATEP
jgi:uncharacterized protein DUF6457